MTMVDHGQLFYVIGASGVGKDSLMMHARGRLADDKSVIFAHRYITRPVELGGENHIALSDKEFDSRLHGGCFAMHWYSHGLSYGIGIEINQWLVKGINVVMNGSRGYLQEASWRYPELRPVLIRVSPDKLKQRLLARGRESAEDIKHRLTRASQFESLRHLSLITITNDGLLEEAGEVFAQLISSHAPKIRSSYL